MITAIWFLVALVCIPIATIVARRRERHPVRWALLTALLGPLTLIVLALMPGPRCPHCRRHMKPHATVCGHCGRDVPARRHSWDYEQRQTKSSDPPSTVSS